MGNEAEEAALMLGGRIAIVTGAGGGLGRSHALQLARLGAKILVNDISIALAEQVAREIERAGGEAIAFAVSVRDACSHSRRPGQSCPPARVISRSNVTLTQGACAGAGHKLRRGVVANWNRISDRAGEVVPDYGFMPMERELASGPVAELKAANS